jgi:ribosome-associated protein
MEEPLGAEGHAVGAVREDARDFALAAARIASENKIEAVTVLDLRGLSTLADYFVVGTGTSTRQMHAVLDQLATYAATLGRRAFNVADVSDASWLLAD